MFAKPQKGRYAVEWRDLRISGPLLELLEREGPEEGPVACLAEIPDAVIHVTDFLTWGLGEEAEAAVRSEVFSGPRYG